MERSTSCWRWPQKVIFISQQPRFCSLSEDSGLSDCPTVLVFSLRLMKRQGPLTEPDAAYVFKQARQARALDLLAVIDIINIMNIICSFDIISTSQRLWSFASLLKIEFTTVVSHCLSASGRFWNGILALHAKTLFSNTGL